MKPTTPPEFPDGTQVRVILKERNQTPRVGTVARSVWHFKDQQYLYFLVDDKGRKVSKTYRVVDLERLIDPPLPNP